MIETDAASQPFEVDDLEGAMLLDLITEAKETAWRAERRKLRLAYRLCVTNPTGPGVDPATWGDGIPGLADYDQTLGGQGTPLVAAFVTESWATATAVSTWAAKRLLANTLDLHHRLPRTWAAIDALELEPWRGCKIAEDTHDLSEQAAGWVDQELARLGRYGIPTIEKTIRSAIAKFHPDKLDGDPSPVPGKDSWDVSVDHGVGAGNGTSRLDAMGDSLDLAKFHDLISDEATTMGRLGDTDTFGQRKAKALGVIADRQATADLIGLISPTTDQHDEGTDHDAGHDSDGLSDGAGDSDPEGRRAGNSDGGTGSDGAGTQMRPRKSYLKTRLYIHVDLADLATGTTRGGMADKADVAAGHEAGPAMAETNLFGAVTTEKILDWIRDLGPEATLTPVIDHNHDWAVDRHDPPEAMREHVLTRDRHCVFPHCTVDSRRCDLDHIVAYHDTGPPGQTKPENLAPLCRRHHLTKTHGRWSYVRNKDGTHTWTNQYRRTWLVTPHGTIELPTN